MNCVRCGINVGVSEHLFSPLIKKDGVLCERCKSEMCSQVDGNEFDPVDNPKHYEDKNISVIDYIVDTVADPKSYCIGNVIKYISRYDRKENAVQDLRKAEYYLKKTIELLEKEVYVYEKQPI